MPNPFFIQNPATKFVIDIAENPAQSGDLDAFNKKSSREEAYPFDSGSAICSV